MADEPVEALQLRLGLQGVREACRGGSAQTADHALSALMQTCIAEGKRCEFGKN
jgi:hypothetical protein